MVNSRFKTPLILGVASMVLTACATSGGPGAAKLAKQSEYMLQGCIGGGVIGGVLGSWLGEGGEDARKSALLGCALGAVVGLQISKRTQEYINANEAIDSEIKRNKVNAAKVHQYNQGLQENIEVYQQKITTIRQKKTIAKDRHSALQEMKKLVSQQSAKAKNALTQVNSELALARQQQAKYSKQANATEQHDWRQQIAKLEKERNILSSHVQTLSAMNSSI